METMNAQPIPMASQREYARLLSRALPAVVQNEEQHDLYLEQLESLLEREETLTPAERELAGLLTLLIEDFEDKHYRLPPASSSEILEFLIGQHNLKQKDLTDVFRTPSIVSEVLSGKRELNKGQIERLSRRFHVSPGVFFPPRPEMDKEGADFVSRQPNRRKRKKAAPVVRGPAGAQRTR
jgi:HTH-type transcriptional regulator/antitoxin HigA